MASHFSTARTLRRRLNQRRCMLVDGMAYLVDEDPAPHQLRLSAMASWRHALAFICAPPRAGVAMTKVRLQGQRRPPARGERGGRAQPAPLAKYTSALAPGEQAGTTSPFPRTPKKGSSCHHHHHRRGQAAWSHRAFDNPGRCGWWIVVGAGYIGNRTGKDGRLSRWRWTTWMAPSSANCSARRRSYSDRPADLWRHLNPHQHAEAVKRCWRTAMDDDTPTPRPSHCGRRSLICRAAGRGILFRVSARWAQMHGSSWPSTSTRSRPYDPRRHPPALRPA